MTEPTPEATPAAEETAPTATVTAEDLAKLQTALDRERDLRKAAEKEAKEGRAAKAKVEEIEAASKPELERVRETAFKEGAAQALQQANSRLVAAEARALAAEAQFRSPATAVKLLDLSEVSVTDTGEVDTEAIKEALKRLGEDEPYLLAGTDSNTAPAAQAGIGVGASKAVPSTAQDKIAAGLARYMQ
jgi:hypothetical protein